MKEPQMFMQKFYFLLSAAYLFMASCLVPAAAEINLPSADHRINSLASLKKSRAENAEVEKALGDAFARGSGVAQSDALAIVWYEKAARRGLASAQAALGAMILNNRGGKQGLVEAESWLRKAAEQGIASAQYNLGTLYLDNRDATDDPIKGQEWVRRAAEQGLPVAQFTMGYLSDGPEVRYRQPLGCSWYEEKEPPSRDERERQAFFWRQKAAVQGDASAEFVLGEMICDNEGDGAKATTVEQAKAHEEQALVWYRKAAEKGLAIAQYAYAGSLDANLLGPASNARLNEAVSFYEAAARQGHAGAQERLAQILLMGEQAVLPGKRDYARALDLLVKAGAAGRYTARTAVCAAVDFAQGRTITYQVFGDTRPRDAQERQLALALAPLLKEPRATYLDEARLNREALGEDVHIALAVPFDDNQTVAWYKAAAVRGDARAQYRLAVMLARGNGVSPDARASLSWLRRAASRGDAFAEALLGQYYEKSGPEQDFRAARLWTENAARRGHADARFRLAKMIQDSRRAYDKDAFHWFLLSAKAGHPGAAREVATYYFADAPDGPPPDFMPRNVGRALKWLKFAADRGDVAAVENLADRYAEGVDVAKNHSHALELRKQAAALGSADAANVLGDLYAKGEDAPRDIGKALDYYMAAAGRDDQSCVTRGKAFEAIIAIYETLGDDAKLFSWASNYAKSPCGGDDRYMRLGDLYAQGRGVVQDYAKAFEWYGRAAEGDNRVAIHQLARFYMEGLGVPKDPIMAHYLLSVLAIGDRASRETQSHDEVALRARDALAVSMSGAQLAEAEAMLKAWRRGAIVQVRRQ
jgi:TPR repeat protein